LSGVMRSSGTVLWPTAIAIFAIWGVEVPVAYLMMRVIGIDGIWIGYPASFCAMLLFQTLYYKLVWKKMKLQRLV
jgi:Na+-driven multidrug efflux pump